jgi:hypothetical protein
VVALEAVRSSPAFQAVVSASTGANTLTVVALVLLASAILLAVGGSGLLSLTGRWYERRLISDLRILTDSVWLSYLVVTSILLVSHGTGWMLMFLPSFALHKVVLARG